MLCDKCDNILRKIFHQGEMVHACTCSNIYTISEIDTLIYDEEKKDFTLAKDGRSIWHYPSNPKVKMQCNASNCKEPIVAYEVLKDLSRVYGCKCGYSWKEQKETK